MKKSEAKEYIKELIVAELTEVDADKSRGTVVMPKASNPQDIKKMTDQGVDVELKEELDDIDDKLIDIDPNDSVIKLASKLADTEKEMKTTLNQYKKAKGDAKISLLNRLRKLTAIKKELTALTTNVEDEEDTDE